MRPSIRHGHDASTSTDVWRSPEQVQKEHGEDIKHEQAARILMDAHATGSGPNSHAQNERLLSASSQWRRLSREGHRCTNGWCCRPSLSPPLSS